MKKNVFFVANVGTIIEWAEFTFYAYIADRIAALFFPRADSHVGILAAFAIFAISYLMRPLGAAIFGHMGDRFGRRAALQCSIFVMGFSAMCMGLLPTYAVVGIYAPVLLLVCRCVQGLAVSGEFNGSAIFLIEHARHRPALAGSWTGWGAGFGMLVGSIAAAFITLPGMPVWAWRIPFLLGGLVCVCGLYLRRRAQETPEFLTLLRDKKISQVPLMETISRYPRRVIVAAAVAAALGIYIYLSNVYYVAFLGHAGVLPEVETKMVGVIGQIFVILFFPLAASLADRHGAIKIMMWGFALSLIVAPLLYALPATHSFWLIALGQMVYAIPDALFGAPIFKFMNDLFPARLRYSAISLSYNVGIALFAGTAPMIAAMLQNRLHAPMAPAFYIMLASAVALIGLGSQLKWRKSSTVEWAQSA